MGRKELEQKLKNLKNKSKKNMWHQHMFVSPKTTSEKTNKKDNISLPLLPSSHQQQKDKKRKDLQNSEDKPASKKPRVQGPDKVEVEMIDVPKQQLLPHNLHRVEALKNRFAHIITKAQGKSMAEVPRKIQHEKRVRFLFPAEPKSEQTTTPEERRKQWIKAQREAARRAIESVKNTADFCDSEEVTNEFLRLIGFDK